MLYDWSISVEQMISDGSLIEDHYDGVDIVVMFDMTAEYETPDRESGVTGGWVWTAKQVGVTVFGVEFPGAGGAIDREILIEARAAADKEAERRTEEGEAPWL